MKLKYIAWFLFAFFAIGVGCYPFLYLFKDMSGGLLALKSPEVLSNAIWQFAFYSHIILGGIALMIGWIQFSKKMRAKNIMLHRRIGQLYIITVMISGTMGLYIAGFATGGWISILGFTGLALSWLITTYQAYVSIRKKEIKKHEEWMIRSYALTFAAVTLRLYLPIFDIVFAMDFISAYLIIAWLCWVPNLLIAEWIIRQRS